MYTKGEKKAFDKSSTEWHTPTRTMVKVSKLLIILGIAALYHSAMNHVAFLQPYQIVKALMGRPYNTYVAQ